MRNRLKKLLLANEPSFVFAVRSSRSPEVLSLAIAAKYDGLYVDLQHSPLTTETTADICRAALHMPITALVRPPTLDSAVIGLALDAGAAGVLVPDVESVDAAHWLVDAVHLAPLGRRSRASGLPHPWSRTGELLPAEETLVIAMLESEGGLNSIEAIAMVDGIDAVQIGSNDLSAALGTPGDFAGHAMRGAYRRAIAACAAANKPLIVGGIRDPDAIAFYIGQGAARCYFTGTDTLFTLAGARNAREGIVAGRP